MPFQTYTPFSVVPRNIPWRVVKVKAVVSGVLAATIVAEKRKNKKYFIVSRGKRPQR
jgi:hypothetical protein